MFNWLANRGKQRRFLFFFFNSTLIYRNNTSSLVDTDRAYTEKLEKTLNVKENKQTSKQANKHTETITSPVLEFREGLDCRDYKRKNSVCFPAKESS